eukprot:1159595-Pelagomonas_calceolata.AAC.3
MFSFQNAVLCMAPHRSGLHVVQPQYPSHQLSTYFQLKHVFSARMKKKGICGPTKPSCTSQTECVWPQSTGYWQCAAPLLADQSEPCLAPRNKQSAMDELTPVWSTLVVLPQHDYHHHCSASHTSKDTPSSHV